jgi:peptidyl-prolyl cis-trans isomerase D
MLTKIREKSQGTFAWIILGAICVPFALWGINNYINDGQEPAVASVGSKDFYQRDVNRAYEQYAQNFKGMNVDEQSLKAQALQKLIKDEVLLQYVSERGLTAADNSVRDFIQELPYFQTEGKFDEKKYKSLLATQRLSSLEFVARIKKALVMEQFQESIINSSFTTPYDIDSFFKIQNQQRDIAYITLPLQTVTTPPSEKEITDYYEQHKDNYQTPEQVSVEYIELAVSDIAKTVTSTEEKLKAFYEEQKDQYSTPERRKISHILFAINDKQNDAAALAKAEQAQKELANKKDFAVLAKELSDDKLTAKEGGDLGLFAVGSMEKDFETAASSLKLNEVSKPVKSKFGYHLIKVTELVPASIKSFDSVKDELTKSYQKNQAENIFYEQGEKLTESSYENPDSLQASADALKLTIKKTDLFSKTKGEGIASEEKVRNAAFAEEVLQGNNSAPIELGNDKLVVVRLLDHKAATTKELASVKTEISATLLKEKAKQLTSEKVQTIKAQLLAGESLNKVASDNKVDVKQAAGITRTKSALPAQVSDALFKAAKPVGDKPTIFSVALPTDEQVIVSLNKVTDGALSEDDKKQLELAKKNIGNALGQSEFNAAMNSLQAKADISIKEKSPAQ